MKILWSILWQHFTAQLKDTATVTIKEQRLNTAISHGPIRHQARQDGFKFLCKVLTIGSCQVDLSPWPADPSSLSFVECRGPTWLSGRRPASSGCTSNVSVRWWGLNVDVNTTRCSTSYTHHSATAQHHHLTSILQHPDTHKQKQNRSMCLINTNSYIHLFNRPCFWSWPRPNSFT